MLDPAFVYRATIRSVYDGDTCRLDLDLGFGVWLRNQPVRLLGIDTPELRGSDRPAGLAARDYLRGLLPEGREVVVETERDATGKYGRWLARIWHPDLPVSVNQHMIDVGHARANF